MGELHHIWCFTTRNLFYGCWGGLLPRNPQDFHFCINYSFSDGLRPSWPQSICSVEFLLNFELGTYHELGERDNHYTTETCLLAASRNL